MNRKLGRLQKELLRCIKQHGSWSVYSGWVWDTPSNTERILKSLVRRGLVKTRTDWSGSKLSVGTTVYEPTGEDND